MTVDSLANLPSRPFMGLVAACDSNSLMSESFRLSCDAMKLFKALSNAIACASC